MIILKEGSKKMLPYVEVQLEAGRLPFQWWYEVHYWSKEENCWYHDWEKDGGAFGFWRAYKKANEALCLTWDELANK